MLPLKTILNFKYFGKHPLQWLFRKQYSTQPFCDSLSIFIPLWLFFYSIIWGFPAIDQWLNRISIRYRFFYQDFPYSPIYLNGLTINMTECILVCLVSYFVWRNSRPHLATVILGSVLGTAFLIGSIEILCGNASFSQEIAQSTMIWTLCSSLYRTSIGRHLSQATFPKIQHPLSLIFFALCYLALFFGTEWREIHLTNHLGTISLVTLGFIVALSHLSRKLLKSTLLGLLGITALYSLNDSLHNIEIISYFNLYDVSDIYGFLNIVRIYLAGIPLVFFIMLSPTDSIPLSNPLKTKAF